jgi:hypothetical protein
LITSKLNVKGKRMPNIERDEIQFKEPILEQKDVKAQISFAEPTEWRPKAHVRELDNSLAESYKACKLTITLTDLDSVKTEHADALPKSIIEDQFNVQKYPYMKKDKKTNEVSLAWMNRGKLFDLESAFGFEPCFVDREGNQVEPFVTRTGNKVAPKIDGVARVLNPEFLKAYFHEDMTVNPTNWIGKDILIDVGVEKSDQFGDKNVVTRYKKVSSF